MLDTFFLILLHLRMDTNKNTDNDFSHLDLSFMDWAMDRISREHESNLKAAEELGHDKVFALKERTRRPNKPKK